MATSEIALGGLATAWSPWVGGVLATVGLVRVGLRAVAGRRRRQRVKRPQAALFLDPRIARLELTETLKGSLDRTPERCRTTVKSASGKIELEAVWARADTKTLADHRRKHKLVPDAEVPFSQAHWSSAGRAGCSSWTRSPTAACR